MEPNKEIPRRHRLDLNTPAELAIHNAMQEVEKAGAHPKLTDAINLLQQAKEAMSDFVDATAQFTGMDEKETVELALSAGMSTFLKKGQHIDWNPEPLKVQAIESAMLHKYLTPEALMVCTTPVYNTVHEHYVQVEGKHKRSVGFVEYLGVIAKTPLDVEPTEEQIARFCEIINQCVKDNHIGVGSLCPPSYMKLQRLTDAEQDRWIFTCYSLGTNFIIKPDSPDVKYIMQEGELPTETI